MCYILINDNADGFDAYMPLKVKEGEYKFTYRTRKEALEAALVANEAKSVSYSTTMESHLNKVKMDEQRNKDNKNTKRRYRI